MTKLALKYWAKQIHSSSLQVVDNPKSTLEFSQSRLEEEQVIVESLEEKKVDFQTYQKSIRDEESIWHIKSKSLWLKDIDKRTFFFRSKPKLGY
jgi:hypothetical protein